MLVSHGWLSIFDKIKIYKNDQMLYFLTSINASSLFRPEPNDFDFAQFSGSLCRNHFTAVPCTVNHRSWMPH